MPNRIVRENILTSDRVNKLSAEGEVFYRRLMSRVDDYGRYDARPSILRSTLYPLRVDTVSADKCEQMLAECTQAGLVTVYQDDKKGTDVLQMLDTRWKTRTESRYPQPPDANKCQQMSANARLVVDVVVNDVVGKHTAGKPAVPVDKSEGSETEGRTQVAVDPQNPPAGKRSKRKPMTSLPPEFGISKRVRDWAYENGFSLLEKHLAHFITTAKAKDYQYADWDSAFENAIRTDWAKLRVNTPAAANEKKEWWETSDGITEKGKQLDPQVLRVENPIEPFPYFKLRVLAAAGEGPWNKRT